MLQVWKSGSNACDTKRRTVRRVDCFEYLGSQVAADRGCERDVVHKMNERHIAWGAMKNELSNRRLGIKAKKCLYDGVIIVPTAF